jgi:hypothetical protein
VFFTERAAEFLPLAEAEPERDPSRYSRGEHVWTVQTCVRLARAGHRVTLADRAPASGIVVFHVKERRALLRTLPRRADLLLVGARADNRSTGAADVEIVQNGAFSDGRRRIFLPHWPQPGLIPRDPGRGTAIRRAAFKGLRGNLAPAFAGEEWRTFLEARGVEWVEDAAEFDRGGRGAGAVAWHDYSDIDLIVAVRAPDHSLHRSKPATKLLNAWLAGVPAVLGEEFAFREMRRSPLDYIEARDVEEAKAAVARLAGDAGLYRAMVENGRRRAAEFDVAATTERWRALLFETLPAFADSPRGRLLRRLPPRLKMPLRALLRIAARRPAR